ncbi:MAG: trigger factor [Lachnospiraceae bacterium]|nr:trigger factor [Lachnospiraceae bacterium]
MSEENELKDVVSGIEDAADTANEVVKTAEESVEAVENAVNTEAEVIAEKVEITEAVLNAEGVEPAGSEQKADGAENSLDAERSDGSKTSENSVNIADGGKNIEKVSGKTTAVLICTIVVIVALIVVFAVLIGKKYFDNKNKENAGNDTTVTSGADQNAGQTTTGDPSNTSTDDGNDDPLLPREYDVTVELGQYKGLEIDFPEIDISEEDIDYELENFVEDLTEEVPVDRPSQNGDILNIDYKGYMDGEEFDGGSAEGIDFELGAGYFFDAFEEGLVGKEKGEHTLELNFPDDYYEDLAGKPVTFVVTINSIAESVVPELTDQLIADNTDYETIEEYRAFIKGELTEEAEADAEDHLERDILYLAIGNATFGGEIDEEIDDLKQQYFDYYDQMAQSYYGMTGAELFNAFYGMTEEDYTATILEESSYSVKVQHLLDKIAEVENIDHTEEEYKAEFEEIFFSYYGFTEEAEVKEQLSDEEIDRIVINSIKQKKAQAIIIDNAIINR